MNVFLAILQFVSEGSSDMFGIMRLNFKTVMSSSEEGELLLLKVARKYLLHDRRAESENP